MMIGVKMMVNAVTQLMIAVRKVITTVPCNLASRPTLSIPTTANISTFGDVVHVEVNVEK